MPFIVLEGLDGAGKSTQIALLREYLKKRDIDTEYLHFPRFDAPIYGDLVARFLRGELGTLDGVDPYIVALLFAGDRAEAAKTINGWLADGKWVIADRYIYSNVAYQCAKIAAVESRQELRDWIMNLEYNHYGIPVPDVSLFLDVPFSFTHSQLTSVRKGNDRDYLKGGEDIHETSLPLQRLVCDVYMWIAQSDPLLKVVDCSDGEGNMGKPEDTFVKIKTLLCETLDI